MIYDHNYKPWKRLHNKFIKRNDGNQYNGAYYYSIEIVRNIIPRVRTDRDWWTITVKGHMTEHSIVFIHQNSAPEKMEWIKDYDDVILVCSLPQVAKALKKYARTIYIPLSVDVEEVKKYRTKKTKDTAYIGRKQRLKEWECEKLPDGIDYIYRLPREKFLAKVAKYKTVYASERAAIEAKILGCKVEQYVKPLMDVEFEIIDNKEAAKMLQKELDKIDKGEKNDKGRNYKRLGSVKTIL